MANTKTLDKASAKKGADKCRFSLTKSKSGNKIIKLRKGFLMKCGHSIKKFADSYAVHLDFDDKAFTLNLDYGKVAISDFMPTGDNWEMWYGDANVPTDNPNVDIVVEAYMFVKPYGIDNDHRKTLTSYMDNMDEGFNRHVINTFRDVYPEYTGVSDENLTDVQEFNELYSLIWEQSADIQSMKVTGKMRFFAYDNEAGSLTKIHSFNMNSSSDFFMSVEEFITYLEANSHEEWWTALNKFDEYLANNGYSASARKSKVRKGYDDVTVGDVYNVLQDYMSQLSGYDSGDKLDVYTNTYFLDRDGVSYWMCMGRRGFVSLESVDLQEEEYYDEDDDIGESARKSKPVIKVSPIKKAKPTVKGKKPTTAW